ncbi:uncharacterized protein LOC127442815 [Myxocyprinus asiaticus]|uniref:uncharacterized protein LOC127442815 n=1 Tax=Myxocyprinus asiaticus TaxID=70543 RepID=UPI002223CC7F|nr:uncharacterized protein LOC127442815 [Myxocyprinus asiaticus]
MCMIMNGAFLLCLLCFWTQRRVDAIDPGVLASIIHDIKNVANMNNQYAFAVDLQQEQCRQQGLHDFGDNTNDIRNGLNGNTRMYLGQRVITARPLFKETYTDHAEYRLLVTQQGHSPMADLLERWRKEKSCTVFFTLYSPCGSKCTRPDHKYNILPYLNVFNNLDHNWVAFVFQDIFDYELKHSTRKQMLALLQTIHENGGFIPVYRCPTGTKRCVDCMADQDPMTNQCLDGMPLP